jgi:hypothetical protein
MILPVTLFFLLVFTVELTLYTLFIPYPYQGPLKPRALDKPLGTIMYFTSYLLSLLRAPLGLLPYLVKLFIFFVLRTDYESSRSTYKREVINMLGDIVNLCLSIFLVYSFVGVPTFTFLAFLFYLPIMAELVRLKRKEFPFCLARYGSFFHIGGSLNTVLHIKDRTEHGR